ncbi:MAG TPA: hypothetical protein PK280_03425 [Planctomycetota bacterium]|nr:hypothetical protein [Planctomycetota bacterium]
MGHHRFGSRCNGAPVQLAYPVAAKAFYKHIYVGDSANRRVVGLDPTWKAEESCGVQ